MHTCTRDSIFDRPKWANDLRKKPLPKTKEGLQKLKEKYEVEETSTAKDGIRITAFDNPDGILNYGQRLIVDARERIKRAKRPRIFADDYRDESGRMQICHRKKFPITRSRMDLIKLCPRYQNWALKRQQTLFKMNMHQKVDQITTNQDRLNEALDGVQAFMDKTPNFTTATNRSKIKALQQKLLKSAEIQLDNMKGMLEKVKEIRDYEDKRELYHSRMNRGLLLKLLYFQAQTLPLWISTLKQPFAPIGVGACAVDESYSPQIGDLCAAFYDETWILAQIVHVHNGSGKYELRDVDGKSKKKVNGVIVPPPENRKKKKKIRLTTHPKDMSLILMKGMDDFLELHGKKPVKRRSPDPNGLLYRTPFGGPLPKQFRNIKAPPPRNYSREELKSTPSAKRDHKHIIGKLMVDRSVVPLPRSFACEENLFPEFDEEGTRRKKGEFCVFRKRIIPLPQYRADPMRDAHALFPAESIVLALYPQTTCFYKGVIISPPQTAIDDYLISFEDKVYPSGWSPPSKVPQKYVVTYKEIKTHKKKMNIFDEIQDDV